MTSTRAEGVYVSVSTAGLAPFTARLFLLERVNENDSISSVEITEAEARSMIVQLGSLGVWA